MLTLALGFGLILVVYLAIRHFGSGSGQGGAANPGHSSGLTDSSYISDTSPASGHGYGHGGAGHGCECGSDCGCDSGGGGGCGCDGGGSSD